MKKMKSMKKLVGMLLAMVMVLGLCGTAFAADAQPLASSPETTGSITISGCADGETYSIYQMFELTYADDYSSYSYKVVNDWEQFITGYTYSDSYTGGEKTLFTLDSNGYLDPSSAIFKEGVADDSALMVEFAQAALAYAQEEGITATETQTASNSTVIFENLNLGYYLVGTSLGSLCILDSTVPNVEVEEKNGIPTISKWVHENTDGEDKWGNEDDAYNMEEIKFEIEVDNITGAVNLTIHDAMDSEFVIDWDTFELSSIVLYTSSTANAMELSVAAYDESTGTWGGGDYYITHGSCSDSSCNINQIEGVSCTFEIHFIRNFDDVDETGYIELTYSVMLDTESASYDDDVDEIDNYAQLTFGTTSQSTVVETETFAFEFEIYKYTGEITETDGGTPLADAEFTVKGSNGLYAYFKNENNVYMFEGWAQHLDDVPEGYTATVISGEDGKIYVEGLDTGTYTVNETQAPDGYNPLTGDITVAITAEYDVESGALITHTVSYSYNGEEGTGVVNVLNNTGSILPGTGGMGTTIFYIIGIVIVAGAVVLLVTRRRMNRAA